MTDSRERSRPWLETRDPKVPAQLAYPDLPLTSVLDAAAAEHGDHEAVRFKNLRWSWRELQARAEEVAAGLASLGVAPGDRVATLLPNLPQTLAAHWGILKAGAVAVPLNPLSAPPEIERGLRDAGARHVIVLDLLWPKLDGLTLGDGHALTVIVTRVADGLRFPLNWLQTFDAWRHGKRPRMPFGNSATRRVAPWKSLFRHGRLDASRARTASDPAILQFTGGTTGAPKAAILTHGSLLANVVQCRAMLHGFQTGREVFVGVLPFFHIYAVTVCVHLSAAIGASLIPVPRFEPLELLKLIAAERPTIFPGAPAVYSALLRLKELESHDLTSISYCVSGSAPLPVETLKRFTETAKAVIIEGYGLTEASPVTHLNPLHGERKAGTIGLPLPDTDCRIVDERGRDAAPGEPGELWIKGPQVMAGYWNRPEETARTLTDGWLATGDVATMDEDGYFTIVDRLKDVVLVGGFNVYPREVEEVLHAHPDVAEAVVVGIRSETRGESLKAFVIPRPGSEPDRAAVIEFCRERLAAYKVPRAIEFRSELPRSAVGKTLRRLLREEAEKQT